MARFPNEGKTGTLCRDLSVSRHHLVMRAVRDTMIIAPPLVISRDECDELVERARGTLDSLADALAREGALA
jgi:putrescine aminotransferase